MGYGFKKVIWQSKHTYSNMVLQFQEEIWLDYQKTQGKLFCGMGCPEYNVFWTLKLLLFSGPVFHGEVHNDFEFYYKFKYQSIDFRNDFSREDIPIGENVFIEYPRD